MKQWDSRRVRGCSLELLAGVNGAQFILIPSKAEGDSLILIDILGLKGVSILKTFLP